MKAIKWKKKLNVLAAGCLAFVSSVNAENSYSPYVNQDYPTNVYWGDTHLHTNLSTDAYISGNRLTPDEAYRFARGTTISTNSGQRARLNRPLDFLVIADHANSMGVMQALERDNRALLRTEEGQRLHRLMEDIEAERDPDKAENLVRDLGSQIFLGGRVGDSSFRRSIWEQVTASADKYNDPGKFTAFIGYEWTAMLEGSYGPHRVVIFRDKAEKANQIQPFSHYDSDDPENLWAFLSDYENKTGGRVLAIPHNGNLTRGAMFALENFRGMPLNKNYAKTRSRWEPLYEVTQTKGDSETHPVLSPMDEFADYETWTLRIYEYEGFKQVEEAGINEKYEYARSALILGLQQRVALGVNPFKFGMIGSTDAHTSLSAVEENNFWGPQEPKAKRATDPLGGKNMPRPKGWRMSSSGYAAVWAKENSREFLFAAMKRKEVYASTGPRMNVRFFGGWDYQSDDAFKPDLAEIGYNQGVPMGGDLANAPEGKSPRFLIRAVKDPDGANLDRVQVIKGWRNKQGELHEKIYNVALSDSRKESRKGKVKPVGNTVDIPDASYTNTIGNPELAVVWQDPDFNKNELAFYYARVLEIPTPRWTAYDAKFFGLKNIPEEVPMVTQERAYTSPIWYTPTGI